MDTYRGFQIHLKRDFGRGKGFLIKGRYVKRGYVVTNGTCNVMPGATWAQTIFQARGLIDALIESQGDSNKFWEIVRADKGYAA